MILVIPHASVYCSPSETKNSYSIRSYRYRTCAQAREVYDVHMRPITTLPARLMAGSASKQEQALQCSQAMAFSRHPLAV
jgi:hypothetical protein